MITCKEYAQIKKEELKQTISEMDAPPHLAIIQFGNDPSSLSYIKGKIKDCEEVGICAEVHLINVDDGWYANFVEIIEDDSIDAIIIDKPIPDSLDQDGIFSMIPAEKDVDNLNPYNDQHFFQPCTPMGVMNYLRYNNVPLDGKVCTVIGRSENVGKPLFEMLNRENATVTLCHSHTPIWAMKEATKRSDILFTCTNQIEQFYFDELSNPYIVIDIGLGVGKNGKMHGNIEHSVADRLKQNGFQVVISGPGGVGLLTRVALLENVVRAYQLRRI